MAHNRFFGASRDPSHSHPSAPLPAASSFVAWSLPLPVHPGDQGDWFLKFYRLAYEQTQAALRPSWYERNLLATMN